MSQEAPILDSDLDEASHQPIDVESNVASATKRFLNLVIDYVALMLIFLVLGIISELNGDSSWLEDSVWQQVVAMVVFISYTTLFETFTGKTLGKLFTKTRVVNMYGDKPDFLNLLGRNTARIIPFDAFSYLGGRAVGWHDTISSTRVIND